MRRRHVFGPVASRRLGRSLGIDAIPLKTCSLDCVYCEVGPTTCRTLERKVWVPEHEILAEAEQAAAESKPDVITFSGSGEPTLHSGIGRMIAAIKGFFRGPVAVITNGTMLHVPELRKDLLAADMVMPSLDAADQKTFEAINKPHPGLPLDLYVRGLREFRREYKGMYRLEVFLVSGVNDTEEQVMRIAEIADGIRPDVVELNTTVRVSRSGPAPAVPRDRLEGVLPLFESRAEIIASFKSPVAAQGPGPKREEVEALLRRRPCTLTDIAAGLGTGKDEVAKILDAMRAEGRLAESMSRGERFFGIRG